MSAPLAERLRPQKLDDYIGQEHLVGKSGVFRRFIESKNVPSFILWGPPGVGKTTLSRIVAKSLGREFHTLSAVSAGVKDVRTVDQHDLTGFVGNHGDRDCGNLCAGKRLAEYLGRTAFGQNAPVAVIVDPDDLYRAGQNDPDVLRRVSSAIIVYFLSKDSTFAPRQISIRSRFSSSICANRGHFRRTS